MNNCDTHYNILAKSTGQKKQKKTMLKLQYVGVSIKAGIVYVGVSNFISLLR